MGALDRTLRYLGLGGSDEAESRAADLAAHRDARGEAAGIAAGLTFRGEIAGDGDFHIAGRFEGDINVTGRVLVGEGAEVDANINARAIVVGGTVRGNLSASTRVEILPTGVLTGTLRTGSFSAADGAAVKGEIWIERPSAREGAPERRP
ncbi:MAG TPA: polymer-forming cytoskeletal protein [Candidatus Bathyarchaeia archaeon]|nr:polymer-forming cytoskeletal protein [Candidatus Bathyarchaeia archaeon]